ncbi:MAG: NAD(P)H-dependent oxidoreductase, partial [Clostridia bacterium]|nr:NAD(P)H-dependent oxidoreductase [Clostridia bacterium]
MRILVINGSPKGENSITLQTLLYLKKRFPENEWEVLHAGRQINAHEKDFTAAKEAVESAELIVFSYPVYTFIAPSQLHRFIAKTKAEGVSLSGKAVTQVTTSKHFYDTTAHAYIKENVQDMGASFIDGLSADM